ncbi:hypothetical protein [Bacillus amyloliquefaciens]|uniref:hypothetical protein n=1 Tax=Bacillus amyloliquefaciens TaxID=1390 RepID=UPI002E23FB4C|nr:hypothetical protein [Bacillus amyloliquefaciens]
MNKKYGLFCMGTLVNTYDDAIEAHNDAIEAHNDAVYAQEESGVPHEVREIQ